MINYKKAISISLLIALVGTASGCGKKEIETTAPLSEDPVINYVNGTGVLEAENQFEVSASVMGEITAAPFMEGQQVQAGDLLFQIEQTDLLSNIEKTSLAVQKAQISYQQTADTINKLKIRSSVSGTITNLYINKGDMVAANSKVAEVVNNEIMVLKVPFIQETTGSIYEGQSAEVSIVGSFYTVGGTVKKVTTGSLTRADGSVVKMVEINVPNPGNLMKGDQGTAVIGGIACSDAGTFDYTSNETVIAEANGKVEILNVSVGDRVSSGGVITTLKNDTIMLQQEQTAISIREANVTLENLKNQLKNYNIASTINGTLIKKNLKTGDKINSTNMSNIAVVADLSKIIFKMNVDELDVSKITVGQTVLIVADAYGEKEYTGKVELISVSGSLVNGVSLYEITVAVDQPDGLMPGMNVNAKIAVD